MDTLHILWTTVNKETFFHMLSMYAVNAKTNNWWQQVNIIIWGAPAGLIGSNKLIRAEIGEMIQQGVKFEANKDSCDNFGVSEILSGMGIEVKNMGEPLTEYLKKGDKILTL